MSRLIVYGLGGAGVSIVAKEIEKLTINKEINVETRYMDTSDADIKAYDLNPDNVHLVTTSKLNVSIDGSGGKRSELDEYISAFIPKHINESAYAEGDVYVVITSTSGGSGSLLAPRFISSIKALGRPIICIMLTDTTSVYYCDTTLKTLAHIEKLGRKLDCLIPTIQIDNNTDEKRADVFVYANVLALAVLVTGGSKSMDRNDILSFLVNTYESTASGMSSLRILNQANVVDFTDTYISTMRVLTPDDGFKVDANKFNNVNQYKVGQLSDTILTTLSNLNFDIPIYYIVTINDILPEILKTKERLAEIASRVEKKVNDDLGIDLDIEI